MKKETNKKIYLVLTHTGTILSKIIKIYTKNEYSHISISLDKELKKMYSFGRLYPYNPFIGGFVHEGINIGTFKRFKNTTAKIYSLEVSKLQYEILENTIEKIESKKDLYKFNTTGLFMVFFKKKLKRKKCFYCAEFVKYLFDKAQIKVGLPNIIKPVDFLNIENLELVYEGKLKKYKVKRS